jgi:hypothetical protein
MPNHCSNQLTVTGPAQDIQSFKENSILNNNLKLETIIPSDYNYPNPIQKWGTKWGCYDTVIQEDSPEKLVLLFQTAWCPYNEDVQRTMARKYPTLTFELLYAEQGISFCGYYKANGAYFTKHQEDCYILNVCARNSKCDGCDDCEEVLHPLQRQYQELFDTSM